MSAGARLHGLAPMGNAAPKKRRGGSEPLGTVRPIWPARDLNPRPPAPIAMS